MLNLPDPTVPKAPAGGGSGFNWGSALGGLLSLGGAYLGYKGQKSANATNIQLAQDQMAFSASQAARQMDFQREMAGSQYQRQQSDLLAAGLNPLLGLSGGAASPGGAAGSSAPARVENEAGAMLGTAGAVAQVLQGFQSISQSKAQEDLILAQADKVRSETMPLELNSAKLQEILEGLKLGNLHEHDKITLTRMEHMLKQNEKNIREETFASDVAARKAESAITQLGVPMAQAQADFWKTDFGQATPFIRALMSIFGGTASAASAFRSRAPVINRTVNIHRKD